MSDRNLKTNLFIVYILHTRRAMYLQWNIQQRPRNHCCRVKSMRIKYSDCAFVALSIQHSKRMRRTILSSVASPALSYFSTLSGKLHDFLEKVMGLKCGFWFSLQFLYEKLLIPRRTQRDVITNVPTTSCTVPITLIRN